MGAHDGGIVWLRLPAVIKVVLFELIHWFVRDVVKDLVFFHNLLFFLQPLFLKPIFLVLVEESNEA
jgi:hypothetical protein